MATTSWNKPFTEFIYNTETDKFSASPFNAPPVYPDEYKDLVAEEVDVTRARRRDGAAESQKALRPCRSSDRQGHFFHPLSEKGLKLYPLCSSPV